MSRLQRGFAAYGSDSGHQNPPPGPRGAAPNPAAADWWVNDEAVRNFGYMQMKKTHDAAMVIIERMYGERPRFNYYIGNSQGGREALTVAQRYPADYDGILATVPVVSLSSLQVAPVRIRIHEKPQANWITPAKVNAIRGEFMRQCDKLDGLTDGIINNYMGCRSIFDVSQGRAIGSRGPQSAVRITSIRIRQTRAPTHASRTDRFRRCSSFTAAIRSNRRWRMASCLSACGFRISIPRATG